MADQWNEYKDESSGRIYYHNASTGETSWTRPAGFGSRPPPPPIPEQAAFPVQSSWTEHRDPNTGKMYYHNSVTGATQWVKPDEMKEAERAAFPPPPSRPGDHGSPQPASYSQSYPAQSYAPSGLSGLHSNLSSASIQENSILSEDELEQQNFQFSNVGNILLGVPDDQKLNMRDYTATQGILRNAHEANVGMSDQPTGAALQDVRQRKHFQEKFDLDKFVPDHIRPHKKGLFGKLTPHETFMFSEKLISAPMLLKTMKDEEDDAVQVFRNISAYMGDRPSSKSPQGHINKVMLFGVHKSENIRDEIYVQVLKQLRQNPKQTSVSQGWKLLVLCTGIFAPSSLITPFLKAFFQKTIDSQNQQSVVEYAEACEARLNQTIVNGARMYPPVQIELDAVELLKPIPLRIEFMDETFKTIAVDSQTRVDDLCAVLSKKRMIPPEYKEIFALFQMAFDRGETLSDKFLGDGERLLDIIASWYMKRIKYRKNHPKSDLTFKLVFKLKVIKREILDTVPPDVLQMYFIQGVSDVVSGRLPTTDEQAFELAALELQGIFGDADPGSHVSDNLRKYLPQQTIANTRYNHANQITQDRQKFKGIEKSLAQRHYITFLSTNWETFGSTHIPAHQVEPARAKGDSLVYLAINELGFFILHAKTRVSLKFLRQDMLSDCKTPAKDTLEIVAGSTHQATRYVFKTGLAQQALTMIETYAD